MLFGGGRNDTEEAMQRRRGRLDAIPLDLRVRSLEAEDGDR